MKNSKSGTRNQKPETRNSKLETRNQKKARKPNIESNFFELVLFSYSSFFLISDFELLINDRERNLTK